MNHVPLIGLHAPAPECGKTTAARHLVFTKGFCIQSFATPLKAMLEQLLLALGYSTDECQYLLYDSEGKKVKIRFLNKSCREMLQTLGTEWGRELVHSDVWLIAFREKYLQSRVPVVCDDVRFPNEVELFRQLGGKLIKIVRPGWEVSDEHLSNQQLDDSLFDYVVYNSSTLGVLYQRINTVSRILFPEGFATKREALVPMPAQMS